MATKIEWVDESWNPVTGCTKISSGCAHCYAERMARRLAGRFGYPNTPNHFDVTLHPDKLELPLRWKKPRTVFVCSMGDLFHERVHKSNIACVFNVARRASQHTFLFLTKRPRRMEEVCQEYCAAHSFSQLPANFRLGVTIEAPEYSYRADYLRQTPAAIRFLSMEPLLASFADCPGVFDDMDWIIAGGESGSGARPMHPDWPRGIRDQCRAAGVPFFYKQAGAWLHESQMSDGEVLGAILCTEFGLSGAPSATHEWPDGSVSYRVGKNAAGRLLGGREWNEMP